MQVLITSEAAKLPPALRSMIDESQPLAPDVRFFEEKFTTGSIARMLGLGIVLAVIGVLLCLFGLSLLLHPGPNYRGFDAYDTWPFLAGLVFLLGSFMLISSLRGRWAVKRAQEAGAATRYGIFLSSDLLVSRSWFDTTVIPRPLFKGLEDRSVHYAHDGQTKSFALPATIVSMDPAQLDKAIRAWAAQA